VSDFEWPADLLPDRVSFYLQPHTGGTESPFSRSTKVYGLASPRWVASLSITAPYSGDLWNGTDSDWGERIDALVAQLQGRLNRIQLWDFRRPGAAKAFTNADVAAGTNVMTLVGAAPAGIRKGQYLGGDGRPHIITALEVSGSDLVATVSPHFESDIAAGSAIFERVSGFFRLTTDDAGSNPSSAADMTTYSFDFVEDWGPSSDVVYESEIVTFSG
jgi:hypothetical protein